MRTMQGVLARDLLNVVPMSYLPGRLSSLLYNVIGEVGRHGRDIRPQQSGFVSNWSTYSNTHKSCNYRPSIPITVPIQEYGRMPAKEALYNFHSFLGNPFLHTSFNSLLLCIQLQLLRMVVMTSPVKALPHYRRMVN